MLGNQYLAVLFYELVELMESGQVDENVYKLVYESDLESVRIYLQIVLCSVGIFFV